MSHYPRTMGRRSRHQEIPVERRSQSSQPYHAITESYSKEVTHRPLGSVEDFPPEIVEILKDRPRRSVSPPLIRSREDTWTTENFPIVRVPSAQFTDILTELYDYHEIEKYTQRSTSPSDYSILRRYPEFQDAEEKENGEDHSHAPPTYQVIPPTPRHHQLSQGIPLTSSDRSSLSDVVATKKRPLPMYEEYVNSVRLLDGVELRHIDSSSSESGAAPVDSHPPRHVYTHDVYVDSTTGRPYTPGRLDVDKEDCGKLKINVYFKPPHHAKVTPTYELDEIEIESSNRPNVKLRPESRSSDGTKGGPLPHSSSFPATRLPIRTSILRKEHEILTVPLSRTLPVLKSPSSLERPPPSQPNLDEIFPKMPAQSSEYSRTQTQTQTQVQTQTQIRKSPTPELHYTRGPSKTPSIRDQRGDRRTQKVPATRVAHPADRERAQASTPTERSYQHERSASMISRATSHKSEKPQYELCIPVHVEKLVEEDQNRDPATLPLYDNRKKNRQSPEELDYGRFTKPADNFVPHPRQRPTPELSYERGLPTNHSYRSSKTSSGKHVPAYTTQPANVDKERSVTSSQRSSYRERTQKDAAVVIPFNNTQQTQIRREPTSEHDKSRTQKGAPVVIPYNNTQQTQIRRDPSPSPDSHRSQKGGAPVIIPFNNTQQTQIPKEPTPVLEYTRGISKTPSDQGSYRSSRQHRTKSPERVPSVSSARAAHPTKSQRARSPSVKSRQEPSGGQPRPGPFEEVVHIKERYERDETIRRFYPTTTTV